MKGSLFDGDMKAVCFILCETSSSERFTAVPESRVQRQSQNGRVQRKQYVSMYRARTAESRDQSPENDLRNSSSREQNGLRSGFDKPYHNSRDTYRPCHNNRDVFCQDSNDMVISYIQVVLPMSWSTCVD